MNRLARRLLAPASALLFLSVCSLRDAPAAVIESGVEEFTLSSLSLPDQAPPYGADLRLAPGQRAEGALPAGKSRLQADMGMVRFVFPAANYSEAKELRISRKDGPRILITDGEGAKRLLPGVMLNPRAGDAGDEAVYDYRQFLPPAGAKDAAEVLGLTEAQLGHGWRGAVSYGPLRGEGGLRARPGYAELVIAGELTPEMIPLLIQALETEGRIFKADAPGGHRAPDLFESSGAGRADALKRLTADLEAGLSSGKGAARLLSVDKVSLAAADLDPDRQDALCAQASLDFAAKKWRLSFVTLVRAWENMARD